MKIYLLIIVTIICLVLQISFLPALRPFGVVPNLVLVLVAAAALSGSVVSAMSIALISGFVLDITSGSDFGLKTGLLALTVIACAYMKRSGLQLGIRSKLVIATLGISALTWLIAMADLILVGGRIQIGAAFLTLITLIVFNSLMAALLGPLFARLSQTEDSYGVIL